MVLTRNQKRQLDESDTTIEDEKNEKNGSNISLKIVKKLKLNHNDSNNNTKNDVNNQNFTTETELGTESELETSEISDLSEHSVIIRKNMDRKARYYHNNKNLISDIENDNDLEDNESEDENYIQIKENSSNNFIKTDKIQKIIKKSIQNLLKDIDDHSLESKSKNENVDPYEEFFQLKESIHGGVFFERTPLENRKKKLKEQYSAEQIKQFNEQLKQIRDNYKNNCPSIIDILKMNISIPQKQQLLEKVYCLANSEVLSPEYNSNIKFLNANISNNEDTELMKLEEQILKASLNKTDSYRTKILKSKMSFENKVIAYKKLEIMETYEETDTSEYAKYKAWMDSLLSVPFGEYCDFNISIDSTREEINNYIKNVRETLDRKLSFLEKPKDQIINIVTQMIRNPDVNINAIGLQGKPGLGKTAVFSSIAEALGRPCATISLGGESDSSNLTGHNFTYVGSNSGRLIDIFRHTKKMNPVVLFDELDKVSDTPQGKEIIGTLIHLTDSTTNSNYNHDKYFSGIEFDLSKVLFVFTYNDPTKIDRILADRLIKINIDDYKFEEKLEITNKHIINYLLDKFKFNKDDISFTEDAIKYIVSQCRPDMGMRDVKTKIKIILSRINNLLLTDENAGIVKLKYKQLYPFYKSLPVVIPKEHIDILLDESIIDESKIDQPPPFMYI